MNFIVSDPNAEKGEGVIKSENLVDIISGSSIMQMVVGFF